jgi:exosortase
MLFPIFVALAASAGLIVLFPYTTGYGFQRIPIARQVQLQWATEQWQHCWLVPIAVLSIVYLQRRSLSELPIAGSNSGLALICGSLVLYWIGFRIDNIYVAYLSLQLWFAGLILWYLGGLWMRALLFPWAFLVFLWPLLFLESTITFPLRMIMSKASAGVLNAIGIPVILQGTGIMSAPEPMFGVQPGQRFRVDVADPCSGIRSLFALLMISALYGHFTLKTWWQKGILFASSMPLSILGNLVRILMLTFGIITLGPEIAIGRDPLTNPSWFHMLAGYLVFAVALGGMIGVSMLLTNLLEKRPATRDPRVEGERMREQSAAGEPLSNSLPVDSGKDPY